VKPSEGNKNDICERENCDGGVFKKKKKKKKKVVARIWWTVVEERGKKSRGRFKLRQSRAEEDSEGTMAIEPD